MQENARYAMSIIETDVRMANFWGLLSRPDLFSNTASSASPLNPSVTNNCGATSAFVTDLNNHIEGSNNSFALSCNAYGAGAQGGTDVLIIRRASSDRAPQTAAGISALKDSLLIESGRTQAQIFLATAAGTIPAGYAQADVAGEPPTRRHPAPDRKRLLREPGLQRRDGIPIPQAQDPDQGTGLPGRRSDPRVEDLQFQLGVDVNDDRNADVFVNAGVGPRRRSRRRRAYLAASSCAGAGRRPPGHSALCRMLT